MTATDDPATAETEVGAYWFTNLPAGSYAGREEHKAGWVQTFPNPFGEHNVTLVAGEIVTGTFGTAEEPNFGNQLIPPPPPRSEERRVGKERNGDGVWDSGETGLDG